MKSRKCSNCRKKGHDKRNCPDRKSDSITINPFSADKADKKIIFIGDEITEDQSNSIANALRKMKEIAPNGRFTIVQGNRKQLTRQPEKLLTEEVKTKPSRKKQRKKRC